ncbi:MULTISPECIES: DUF6950 family protein [unclassified Ensifer]|uniref:DUF6950 family protein n=1 Tax=unclassified Ensifer TaxID=2633371 RepID=UPI0030100B6A
MIDIDAELRAYIEAANDAPVEWGVSDCSSWSAGWVAKVTGEPVPMPPWHSADEAYALIAEAGSLDALWRDALATRGLRETGDPDVGDVGIIDTGRFGQVGGIFLAGEYFAWRAEKGTRFLVPRRIVRSWSIR